MSDIIHFDAFASTVDVYEMPAWAAGEFPSSHHSMYSTADCVRVYDEAEGISTCVLEDPHHVIMFTPSRREAVVPNKVFTIDPASADRVCATLWRALPSIRGPVLFALVASRALATSKLAAARWASEEVHVAGLAAATDDACYRAMNWRLLVRGELEKEVYHRVANLPCPEVDLLFFDTTSTYFELDEADEPVARDERGELLAEDAGEAAGHAGFRSFSRSKDH